MPDLPDNSVPAEGIVKTPDPDATEAPVEAPDEAPLEMSPEKSLAPSTDEPPNPYRRSTPEDLQRAAHFLRREDIRNSSHQKQISFLRSKGFSHAEIHDLFVADRAEQVAEGRTLPPRSNVKKRPAEPEPAISIVVPRSEKTESGDGPPIITYPEFLSYRRKSNNSSQVTAEGFLKASYALFTASLAMYGAHRYVIEPMTTALTTARHDLAETTQTNLEKLNTKLSGLVTDQPPSYYLKPKIASNDDDEAESDISSASDPTELFHVDTGTQTSPPPSPTTLSTPTVDALANQESTLIDIHTSLSVILSADDHASEATSSLLTNIAELSKSLNLLNPAAPIFTPQGLYHNAALSHSPEDAISRARSEIRSVKGVLLNTKNFPSAGAKTVQGYSVGV
ncbi:MAG: hypothetical protein M1829_006249 [Trizodia sp. TS-e1964]|nr:MAG: hypothetical protein M1829_006249 [Trizodia sp. TS-e1964]